MSLDLYAMALRGIVMGIASLADHALGIDPGCPRAKALKLLRHLREKGPLSRRDLQRKLQCFNASQLDAVLDRLAVEGLVELSGRQVIAVSLEGFLQALHTRPELSEPPYLCPLLWGMGKSAHPGAS